MNGSTNHHPRTPKHARVSARLGFAAASLAVIALFAGITFADDRDLLRERAADPNVMIIFDTSGSMHWSPVCNAEDACEDIDPYDRACTSECEFGDQTCSEICPDFGCLEFGDNDLAPPITIEVDDADMSGQVSITGSWPATTAFSGGAFGGTAVSDANVDKGSKQFTYNIPITESRSYKVFLSVPQSELWATNVRVRVRNTPDAEEIRLNQRFVPPTVVEGETPPPYNPWKLVGVISSMPARQPKSPFATAARMAPWLQTASGWCRRSRSACAPASAVPCRSARRATATYLSTKTIQDRSSSRPSRRSTK